MGVGVQREPSAEMPQRGGQGLHVHAVFQRQRGERVPEIVQPDVSRADGLDDAVVERAPGRSPSVALTDIFTRRTGNIREDG